MGIGIHGSGDVGMADASLDCFHVDASFNHHGSAAMAKIMEADLLQAMLLHETAPLLSHRLRSEGLAVGLADHKVRVGETDIYSQKERLGISGYQVFFVSFSVFAVDGSIPV